jgi:hypothetical protein
MEVTDDALRAYVGARADYYLRMWHSLRTRETSRAGVNKSAFFGGLAWLFYRKIYRPALIVMLIVLIETVVSERLFLSYGYDNPPRAYNLLVILVYSLVIGTFGNVWYYRLAVSRIQDAPNGTTSETLARLGGTSWLSIVGGVGLLFFVLVVLAVIISI